MFKVRQLLQNFSPVGMSIAIDTSCPIPEGSVAITFADQVRKVYEKDLLVRLKHFKNYSNLGMVESSSHCFECLVIDSAQFDMILGLMCGNKCILDLISTESFEDPYFYESLVSVMKYFCGEDCEKVLEEQKEYLPYMSLETAKAVYKNYLARLRQKENEDVMTLDPMDCGPSVEPLCVGFAKKIIANSIYFETELDASEYFYDLQFYQREVMALKKTVKEQEQALLKNCHKTEAALILGSISTANRSIEQINVKLQKLYADCDPQKIKKRRHYLASLYEKDEWDFLRLRANESKIFVENYNNKMFKLLEMCGATLREDLMPYITGPIFIYDEYGFVFEEPVSDKKWPFTHPAVKRGERFAYTLFNLGPWYLENEIRQDLSDHVWALRERIIKEKLITKPMTLEAKILKEECLPKINYWAGIPETDKNAIIDRIIKYSTWDKFNIRSEHIKLTPPDEFQPFIVKGVLSLHRDFPSYLIRMNLN